MHFSSIKYHLQPYKLVARRRTTINHAFASAIAPNDDYDETVVREALAPLEQDVDQPLKCAYCGKEAQTWDHVFGTVKDSEFSGHGHRVGNLLPCCKPCNSSKGNKDWHQFLSGLGLTNDDLQKRETQIRDYLKKNAYPVGRPVMSPDHVSLLEIRKEILELLQKADALAAEVRKNATFA